MKPNCLLICAEIELSLLFGNLKLHGQLLRVVDAFRRFEGGKNCNGGREVKRGVQRGIVADLQDFEPHCIKFYFSWIILISIYVDI